MRSTLTKLGGVVLLAALVGGCAVEKKKEPVTAIWGKDGVKQEQLRGDFGLCGGSFDEAGNQKYDPANLDAIDKCMNGKGYKRTR